MLLKDIYEGKSVLTQEKMKTLFVKEENNHKSFKKSGTFKARTAKVGEKITTTIDGEDETQKTASKDEVVIKGPKGELYIVSEKKFNDRYEVDKPLTSKFQSYKANGVITAYEYSGESFKFIASWDEEMICKSGDYLASPSKELPPPEVYRIERSVFDETYKPNE